MVAVAASVKIPNASPQTEPELSAQSSQNFGGQQCRTSGGGRAAPSPPISSATRSPPQPSPPVPDNSGSEDEDWFFLTGLDSAGNLDPPEDVFTAASGDPSPFFTSGDTPAPSSPSYPEPHWGHAIAFTPDLLEGRTPSPLLDEPEPPSWLEASVYFVHLRSAVCILDLCDALEVLRGVGISADAWDGPVASSALERAERDAVGRALMLSAGGQGEGVSGGPPVWTTLLRGLAQRGDRGGGGGVARTISLLWREALFRVTGAALRRRREQLSLLAESWCLGALREDWERQLEQVDEAVGWCAQELDAVVAAYPRDSLGVGGEVRGGGSRSSAPRASPTWLPHAAPSLGFASLLDPAVPLPTPAGRMALDPDVRAALRDLKAAKQGGASGEPRLLQTGNFVLQGKQGLAETTSASSHPCRPRPVPADGFVSFADWREARGTPTPRRSGDAITPPTRASNRGVPPRTARQQKGAPPPTTSVWQAARVLTVQ